MASFCSQETLKFAEPIGGSAMQIKRYVFVGWPRGGWDFSHVVPKTAPAGFADTVAAIDKAGEAKIRLFNHAHEDGTSSVIFCPEMVRVSGIPIAQLPALIRAYLDGGELPYQQERLAGEHLFICTHGIRDKCCAKFGYGTVRAIKQLIGGGETERSYSIWETSHLIGDRFAGTGIHFPVGHMYGRLNPDVAAKVLASIDRSEVYTPCYRGNVFMDPREQTVEAAARTYLYENGLAGDIAFSQAEGDSYEITIRTGSRVHRAMLELSQREYSFYSNCNQLAEQKLQSKLRWVYEPPLFKVEGWKSDQD